MNRIHKQHIQIYGLNNTGHSYDIYMEIYNAIFEIGFKVGFLFSFFVCVTTMFGMWQISSGLYKFLIFQQQSS